MSEVESLPTVSLAFGNSKGGAWDDKELVNAYDAALLEFHIHNPGPGSWLDKATAALAKGQPLPGANDFGTAWYSAAREAESSKAGAAKAANSTKANSTKATPKSQPAKRARTINPYTPTAPAGQSPSSPTYEPPSPRAEVEVDGAGEDEDEDEEVEEGNVAEPHWDIIHDWEETAVAEAEPGFLFPPPSGEWQPPSRTTRDEAIGYALHAQYWAGYWMGVVRSAGSQSGSVSPSEEPKRKRPRGGARDTAPAWSQQKANGLKR